MRSKRDIYSTSVITGLGDSQIKFISGRCDARIVLPVCHLDGLNAISTDTLRNICLRLECSPQV